MANKVATVGNDDDLGRSSAEDAWRHILGLVGWGDRQRPPRFPGVAMELGLAPKQLGLLWRLAPGEALPMRAIGDALFCDASYVTDLVDRLEERDLIERRADPGDRRVKLVALTPAGERLRERALEMLYEPPAEFAALDADELATLSELLAKAAAADSAATVPAR